MEISFRKLKENDFKELFNWYQKHFVYEWFEQRILSFDEIKAKYNQKLQEKKQDLYIIEYNRKDIGFAQIYPYNQDNNAYEFDIFIGEEEYLSKGIGTSIVQELTNKIYKEYQATSIILRPFKRNERAIHCYEKCGYQKIKEYLGEDTLGKQEKIVVLCHKKH